MWFKSMFSVMTMLMVMGWYLSFFFTISHNFHGVEKHEDTTRGANAENSFLFNQVRSNDSSISLKGQTKLT